MRPYDYSELHSELNQQRPDSKKVAEPRLHQFNRIEIHAADHCVQKCKWCSHAADIAPKRLYSPEDYLPHLQNMHDHHIRWNSIDILGGEPFINPKLADLVHTCKKFSRVHILSNMYWLKDKDSHKEYAEILSNIKTLVFTLYKPLVEKNGGLNNVLALLEDLKEQYPNLTLGEFFGNKPANVFAKIDFHKERAPIANTKCNFRGCKQLLHTGVLVGCCAARRVPDWPEIDTFDITGHIDIPKLRQWYGQKILNLCHHCSIATKKIELEVWQLA